MWKNIFFESCLLSALIFGGLYINANNIKEELYEKDQKIHIIIININNLQFNILNHSFVPPHSILNSKEEQEFRKQYNINNNNSIPEISRFDPVAQIICLKPTEICKILRPSKNAVEANYFRICKNK